MRTNEDRLVASTALRTMSLLVIGALSLAACTGEIVGGDSDERPSVTFQNDMEPWELEMVSVVEDRYEKMSTYASSEGGWGACIRAFSWNTQECKDLYCDYKDIPDDGCKDTEQAPLSCSTYLDHATNAWDKAVMRQQHLDECPKPSSYSLQGHEDTVDQALNRLDRCLAKFCTDRCVIEMQNDDLFFENC